MKSAVVIVAGLAAAVSAQSLSDFPSCALTCLTTGISQTSCTITDFACACSSNTFISSSTSCVQSSCDASDQQKALAASEALCKSVGVTITVATSAATSASSSAAATSAASTTAASVSATSTLPGSPASSVSSEVSSASSVVSSAVTSAVSSIISSVASSIAAPGPTASLGPGPVVPGNSTNGTSPTGTGAPPTQSTLPVGNGASTATAGFTLLALGLVAAVAF